MTRSVNTTKVYDEIIEFIAAGTTPQSVMDFKPLNSVNESLNWMNQSRKFKCSVLA
ncbi:MAG: hypothetical protein ACYTXA_31205 [Nostoc sp.]